MVRSENKVRPAGIYPELSAGDPCGGRPAADKERISAAENGVTTSVDDSIIKSSESSLAAFPIVGRKFALKSHYQDGKHNLLQRKAL